MFKEPKLQAIKTQESDKILALFTPEQQKQIESKSKILSSLAYYIGKDFSIPVELNEPGKGWHWDFKNRKIMIDPIDLLEKPLDYLRFVMSHEGGHCRISRTDFIPLEVWNEPGFSFLMNAIEDPRDNNFVAENYHAFREQMNLAYEYDIDIEKKYKDKANEKLGYQPKFMQAGFEYIKQWFREYMGDASSSSLHEELSPELPDDVREVVMKTIEKARDSWRIYPTKKMADGEEADETGLTGENSIINHAQYSYKINYEKIWPEFKKLVEEDMNDQQMQEMMKEMQEGKGDGKGGGIPQELKDKLAPEEIQELEEAIEKALKDFSKDSAQENEDENEDQGTASKPIDMDSLSNELKNKLKDYLQSLPDDKKKELAEMAEKAIGEFSKEIGDELEGSLSINPAKRAENPEAAEKEGKEENGEDKNNNKKIELRKESEIDKEKERTQEELRKKMEELFGLEKDAYFKVLSEVAPLIDALTGELRDIFIKRKLNRAESGHRFGRKWNIPKRIQEKIAGIPLIRTESREQPARKSEEKDYAITLMVDLSGSMQGAKAIEAFKSAIVLAETLSSLNIKFEIVGFQDILLEFKSFQDQFDDKIREKLSGLPLEIEDENPGGHNNCGDNNDGECLLEASKNLGREQAQNKFIIIFSDGVPAMDSGAKTRSQLDRELKEAVKRIKESTNQKLIGIGLLSDAVSRYYENNLPNVSTKEMVETLGEVLRSIIENY